VARANGSRATAAPDIMTGANGSAETREEQMTALLKTLIALAMTIAASAALAQDKVVYHFDGGIAQATKGLRNIRNHLDVDPKAKIVAIAHAEGVDFLMEGATSTNNQQFAALVGDLMSRGVTFEICEITLRNRNLKKEQFILGPTFTPSGVARIAHLQAREQFVYIKP
jgi:intracellular sulfur oxidation DsrE/DsrF family protein